MGSDAIARLRKAVDNQAELGESEFRLPIMDMCRLVQQASEEARGDLPVDADGERVPLGSATLYRADGSALAVDCYMRDPADGEWRVLDTTGEMHEPSGLHVRRPELDSWEVLESDLFHAFTDEAREYCDELGVKPITPENRDEVAARFCKAFIARAKRLARG